MYNASFESVHACQTRCDKRPLASGHLCVSALQPLRGLRNPCCNTSTCFNKFITDLGLQCKCSAPHTAPCGLDEVPRRITEVSWIGGIARWFRSISGVVVNISNSGRLLQEIAKFEKSFKDPKFMELLADYAKDMADPEVKLSG